MWLFLYSLFVYLKYRGKLIIVTIRKAREFEGKEQEIGPGPGGCLNCRHIRFSPILNPSAGCRKLMCIFLNFFKNNGPGNSNFCADTVIVIQGARWQISELRRATGSRPHLHISIFVKFLRRRNSTNLLEMWRPITMELTLLQSSFSLNCKIQPFHNMVKQNPRNLLVWSRLCGVRQLKFAAARPGFFRKKERTKMENLSCMPSLHILLWDFAIIGEKVRLASEHYDAGGGRVNRPIYYDRGSLAWVFFHCHGLTIWTFKLARF